MILHISHGYQVKEGEDPMVDLADKVMEEFGRSAVAGAHLVDTFPILDKLPDFLAPWRAEALRKHDLELQVYFFPIFHMSDEADH